MSTSKDECLPDPQVRRGGRGARYYLFLLLLFTWGLLFLYTASIALTRLSIPALLGAAILLYFGLVFRNVYRSLNPVRTPILQDPLKQLNLNYEDVVFPSRDGWMLSGWFIPPVNGATVILTHGMGGNRLDLMHIAAVLIGHGFGILMYDMHSHGRSSGNLGTWGWLEVDDLNGAADYLLTRPDVNPDRIGALGFSLGGQVTIRAAADNDVIKAIIAEDPSPAVLADHQRTDGISLLKLFNYAGLWMVYKLLSATSGVIPPPGIKDSIGSITPRPILLISSGSGGGQDLIRKFYDSAGEPKAIWEVPETGHGWIFAIRPEEYQEKVCGFFKQWLAGDERIEYT